MAWEIVSEMMEVETVPTCDSWSNTQYTDLLSSASMTLSDHFVSGLMLCSVERRKEDVGDVIEFITR